MRRDVNQYRLLERLGEGGMGVVYLAEDTRLQRNVALKFITNASPDFSDERARFHREARAAARLNHPNICTVYELGEAENDTFIAMEYVQGRSLKECTHQGPVEEAEIRKWLEQIAEGLQAAHEAGVVHRDIKPANIMITHKGLIKIMDFGIARLTGSETELTREDSTIGTIAYMSPEQARGDAIDQRTDIWSVGVILYELATGQRPFPGAFREAVIYAMMNEAIRPPSERNSQLSEELERIILKCLKKDREERYRSFSELLHDLIGKEVYAGPGTAANAGSKGVQPRVAGDAAKSSASLTWKTMVDARQKSLVAIGLIALLVTMYSIPGLRSLVIDSSLPGSLPAAMHLAILPFDTLSEDPEEQAFSTGIAHLVATNLMRLNTDEKDMWIIPVREVLSQNVTSAREARESFGINLVVSGTIMRFANSRQITIDITDAGTLRVLDSETIDIESEDSQRIQGEVMETLSEMLGLGEPVDSMPQLSEMTSDPEAYKYYIQGLGFSQKYEYLDNIDEAIRLFELAIARDSSYALAYAAAGFEYSRRYSITREIESLDTARQRTQKALALNNELPEAWVAMARVHLETADNRQALDAAEQAVRFGPDHYNANRTLGRALSSNSDFQQAEPYFLQAIELEPGNWFAYNDIAFLYGAMDELEKAIPYLEKVIRLTPRSSTGYVNMGTFLREVGDFEQAEGNFLKAVELQPTGLTYNHLGWNAWQKRDYDNAVVYFEAATELEPLNEFWSVLLANAYMMVDDPENARLYWQRTVELARERIEKAGTTEPYVVIVIAEALARLGQYEEVNGYLDRYLLLEPKTAEYYFNLACVYEYMGDRETALFYFDKAYALGQRLTYIDLHPWLSELVADPAYQTLVEKYDSP